MKELIPPQTLVDMVGGGDFKAIGSEFFRIYTNVGGLHPEAHVLDIGCGCGRMAIPLTSFLTSGTYDGFDIHSDAIAWCRENISREHPNFKFQLVDAYNSTYNPKGTVRAESYKFPYAADSFDFALASSLFTHLVGSETRNYLMETRRVLRPGARALFTFFLLTPETNQLIAEGRTTLRFPAQGDGCYLAVPEDPGRVVAYSEEDARELFAEAGLSIHDIHFGHWPGRASGLTFQDMVIAYRQ